MLTATSKHTEGKDLKEEVDIDIDAFDRWFQQQGKNDPLSFPEKAIISTFCWWLLKIHPRTVDTTIPAPPTSGLEKEA